MQTGLALLQNRVTSDEIGFRCLYGKAKSGLQHVIFASDVMAKVAECFFDPTGIHRMHPAKRQPKILTSLPQRFKHMPRLIGWDVDLPTQFSDIGHAMHPRGAKADLDLLRSAERIGVVREIIRRYRLHHLSCVRPHNRQHSFARCHIGDDDAFVANMALQPCLISGACRGWGDDEIAGLGQAGDGDIRLDPAARVQELSVDDLAHRHRHVGAAHVVQKRLRVRSLDPQLPERGHVVHADILADRFVFARNVVEEVLPLPAIGVLRRLTPIRVPVRPFPTCDFAHHCAARQKLLMERRAPYTACCRLLAVGIVVGVKKTQSLGHPLL